MPNLIQAEGHLIGNPTYSHMQLTKKNREKFKEELVRTNKVLQEIILMHDYYDTSVTAALKVADELLEERYMFVTVDEILFE